MRQDPMFELQTLLQSEDWESSFRFALNQSNLELVMWLCKQLQPERVCASRTLSPEVVLSLVQQLSVDLNTDTAVKVTWLRELLLMEPSPLRDQTVARFTPAILARVQQSVSHAFPRFNNPNNPLGSALRTLLHILNSIQKP